ncbi:hypothetical protein SAMN02746089_01500, partial [Caldanaerobius fijiensis DSM 17918]
TELLHTSENKTYGSFKQMIEKYDKTVLPKLSNRSKLRALMRKYRKRLKKETSEEKKQRLREKISNINRMLQGRKALNRVLRSYEHAVKKEITLAVKFKCICCGYEDDADHVGAVNIRARAEDKEIGEIAERYRYNKKRRHEERGSHIISLYLLLTNIC